MEWLGEHMITLQSLKSGVHGWAKSVAAVPHRRDVERTWGFDREEFWGYQDLRFRDFYKQTREGIDYYRERRRDYPAMVSGESSLEFIQRLPVLSKAEVRDHNLEFWPRRKTLLRTEHKTSGTTGTPLRVVATLKERGLTQAVLESWFLRICGSRWPRTLALTSFMIPDRGSSDLFWYDPLKRQVFLSIYSLSSARRDDIIRLLRQFRPRLIFGYSSAIGEMAHLVGDAVASAAADTVVISTAEVLYDNWRQQITRNLARRVYNLYGSQEGTHFVIECERGGWHIMPLIGIVEIVDDAGKSSPPGDVGRVVVTGLSKDSMPLIRYAIGDSALSTGQGDCSCGLAWPTMGAVEGRSEDLVLTRDGRRIGMVADAIIKRNQIGIREAQLIQRDYDRFDCKLVVDRTSPPNCDQVESGIKDGLASRLGYKVAIRFAYVDEISRGNRGKFKAMIVDFDAIDPPGFTPA
jgi:phenylacetate-CoA ligase